MTSSKLIILTCLTALAIMTSFASVFIGFFEGPQIGHYINSSSLMLTIILVFILMAHLAKDWKEVIKKQRGLLMIIILGLLTHVFIALTLINIRYGYSNWEYKNILTMEFPETNEQTR